MMAALLAFAIPYTDVVERDRTTTVGMWGSRDGDIVAPDSGTITVYQPDGTALVSAAAVTVGADGVAEYALELADDALLGEGWRQEWSLQYPDETSPRIVRRPMAVARRQLIPVIAIADLEEEYPGLELLVRKSVAPAEPVNLQGFIDNAWRQILRRLISDGVCTYKLFDQSFAAEMHKELALYLAMKHLYARQGASTGNRWQELYKLHQANYNAAYGKWNTTVDADHDGIVDSEERISGGGEIRHINTAPSSSFARSRRW